MAEFKFCSLLICLAFRDRTMEYGQKTPIFAFQCFLATSRGSMKFFSLASKVSANFISNTFTTAIESFIQISSCFCCLQPRLNHILIVAKMKQGSIIFGQNLENSVHCASLSKHKYVPRLE